MIRVLTADPLSLDADGLVRPVGGDLEGVHGWSRDAGLRAGPEVLRRLEAMGGLPVGAAVVTPGGGLSVPYLIHAVLFSREEPLSTPGALRALQNALRRASEWEMASLILPPLGLGAGMFDTETLAAVTLREVERHMAEHAWPSEVTIPVREGYEESVFRGALP